ncbi:MAG: DDE-type integrase/transposase/recombinase [Nitrososphaerales archaeon]|nr:DDE-type integrase/transposase/recombinase [Nitrososphaerales archaeon]
MSQAALLREERGRQICDLGDQVRRLDENTYAVKSQAGNGDYQVRATEAGWLCSCPDSTYRQEKCKHIYAVEFSKKLRSAVELGILADFETTDGCISCGSKHLVKDGVRHNKSGDIQKFNCLDCLRYFTVNVGFERMKHNPKAITTALQLYFSGESSRNTAKSLKLLGVRVSHRTVLNWIGKYIGLMEKYLDKITPQVGDTWRADEVYLKVRGQMKYLFAMMDDETRFWIAQEVADTKDTHDARQLLARSRELMGKKPKTFITDGLHGYHMAWKKEYRNIYNPNEVKTVHIAHITLKGDHNNNKMERMNGEFRDREKVMRGLKRKDTPILKGYQIYHNFVRPHMGLDGATPADRAGIIVRGEDKWRTLIQNASRPTKVSSSGREVESA